MMGPTHRLGGVLAALGGYIWLFSTGHLLTTVNPILQFLLIYPFAYYGSTFADLDHHAGSIPSRDVVSLAINKILHLTTPLRKRMEESGVKKGLAYKLAGILDARHRSWQTHSDFTILLSAGLTWVLSANTSGSNKDIILLVGTGFTLGLFAHWVYDAITPEGVTFTPFSLVNALAGGKQVLPKRFHLVPSKPIRRGQYKSYFATGSGWEKKVNAFSRFLAWVLLIWAIYITQPYRIPFGEIASYFTAR